MNTKHEYRATALMILLHVVVLNAGFLMLMAVFNFPDVLRMPAETRLSLFMENQEVIVPVYYFLSLTGFSQMVIAVMLHHLFRDDRSLPGSLAVMFGILSGLFQLIGFIRWTILLPYLAGAETDRMAMAAFVEGAFNRYAGMSIGEHLGFVAQALWTLLLGFVIMKRDILSKNIGRAGIIIGIASIPMSLEPLGGPFAPMGTLTVPVMTLWTLWLIWIAASLMRNFKAPVRNFSD